MANVFIKGDVRIGAYQFPDRKRKALCVVEGNVATVCGYFSSDELADHFMASLADMFGLEEEENGEPT